MQVHFLAEQLLLACSIVDCSCRMYLPKLQYIRCSSAARDAGTVAVVVLEAVLHFHIRAPREETELPVKHLLWMLAVLRSSACV